LLLLNFQAARFTIVAHPAELSEKEPVARRLRGVCDMVVKHTGGVDCKDMVVSAMKSFWNVDHQAMSDVDEAVQLLSEGNLPPVCYIHFVFIVLCMVAK